MGPKRKKKDLNYIVGLEKAISKKYGDIAIQNPSKFWSEQKEKQYLEQLQKFVKKQQKHEDTKQPEIVSGVLIARKLINKERAFNCSVCESKLKTVNDEIYFTKFECCEKCYIKYVEAREERWTEGWRP